MKDKNTIKRKLLTDRSLPGSEQISRHKDFKSLKQNYSAIKSNWLKKLFIGGAAIVGTAVVAVVVYMSGTTHADSVQAPEQIATEQQQAFVQQPLPGIDIPFSSYRISVKNGGTFTYKTGSTVVIPANAFVVKDGDNLSDSVTINYREFHTAYDIFVSGIPMKYDSAGVAYTFESAGMIEIKGYDGNKPLLLNKDKEVEVSMASANNQADFNLYHLDTLNKNWSYKGKDKIVPVDGNKAASAIKAIEKPVKESLPVAKNELLVTPELANQQKYCFNIGYDKKDFPELSAYENVLFEVADNSFKPAYYKISWDKISLQSTESKGLFIVKLKKADTTISVRAKPVFDKEGYDKALKDFEAKQAQMQEKEKMKEQRENSKLTSVNKELSAYNRKDFIRAANFTVDRRFTIRAFGIYNCDRPILPRVIETQQVANVLKEREKEEFKGPSPGSVNPIVYVIEKGKNAVFTFNGVKEVNLNRDVQNLIWTVTDKRQIAFFKPSDFNNPSAPAKPFVADNQEIALAEIKNFSN
ncbi:MAG: hypothetical protein WAQ28_16050 [Bacteroidia bacterium]|jgi:hypothetical protein